MAIPTTKEIYDRIVNDMEQEYGGTLPRFGKNALRMLAAVKAGNQKLLYLYLAKVQKNIFVDTAEPEAAGGLLEKWGRVKLGENPRPPRAAQYEVEVTGTNGAVIPGGTRFKSDDSSTNPGKIYELSQSHTMNGTTDTITVRALEAGLASKLAVGDTMTATEPLSGVQDQVEVLNEAIEPLAGETIEEYRERVELSFRLEPQGGAATDYRLWSLDVQGVRLSYPYSVSGEPEFVDVYVEATKTNSTDGKGTPSTNMIGNVEDAIFRNPDTSLATYKRGRRPLPDIVDVKPITPLDVNIEVQNFVDLTPQLANDIEQAIADYIVDVRPFVPGIDNLTDRRDTFDVNTIIFLIQSVQASVFGNVILEVGGNNVSSYQFTNGEIPYLNNVNIISA